MSFLKDLYDGEIRPCEEIPDTDEFKAAQSALSKAAKELDDALTAEQKVLFNAYKEQFFECINHSYAHAYKLGFLHGAELIKEIPKSDRLPVTE